LIPARLTVSFKDRVATQEWRRRSTAMNARVRFSLSWLICALVTPFASLTTLRAWPDVGIPAYFSEHMVLQQGMHVPIWGTAEPGERVVVALGPRKGTAVAGTDGAWRVILRKLSAGGPLTLTVQGKNTLTVKDVLVGEVWFCSGQSNMEMTVAREDRYWCGVTNEAAEIASADHPWIREFRTQVVMSEEPRRQVEGQWYVCSKSSVGKFSATAYFFARELQSRLGVPVGLLTSSYGASTAQAWISRPALAENPLLAHLLDEHAAAQAAFAANEDARNKYLEALRIWHIAEARAKVEGKDKPRAPKNPDPDQDQHSPCVLFNGMVAPFIPYAIRGAIWYQGESNYPTGDRYFSLMETLIHDWRRRWNEGNLPFLFVQLANYNKLATDPNNRTEMAPVREGQLRTLSIPKTAMAVAIDIGDAANIHPKNKQEVGRRLALAARALVYGEGVPFSGPIYDRMSVAGHSMRIRFKQADGGLVGKDGALTGFAIAGEVGAFHWAEATIEGKSVVVSSPKVPRPRAVRYGWADNPPVNLYNGAGLPASPFRTDAPGRGTAP